MAIGLSSSGSAPASLIAKVRTVLLHLRKKLSQRWPAARSTSVAPRSRDSRCRLRPAGCRRSLRVEHQLRGTRQFSGLCRCKTKIHLERDPLFRVVWARMAAQIVLACCEKDCWSFADWPVSQRSLPHVGGRAAERLHAATALDADPSRDCLGNERCIQRLARERGCGKRQRSLRGAPGGGEANVVDGTAPSEATSMPSACRSSSASPLRNSPQTLWRGVGSRSISVTL